MKFEYKYFSIQYSPQDDLDDDLKFLQPELEKGWEIVSVVGPLRLFASDESEGEIRPAHLL